MSSECIVEIPEGTNRSRTDIPNPRSQDVSNTDSLSHLEKSPIKINDQSPQIRDLQAGKESSDRSSYKRAPSAKWYFKEDPEKYSRNEYVFSCTSEHQPPVKTPAANRFTRCIRRPDDTQKIKSGVFNIVLGISIANLNLDYIESISFNFGPDIPYYSDPLEVITADELRRLSATSGSRESRWGLHRQFDETKSFMKSFAVDMEIRKSLSAPPKLDLGFVELFYVELHEFRVDTFQNDPPLQLHQPFLWSINVGQKGESAGIHTPIQSTRIIHCAVSGNGNYVSTLSVNGKDLQLDVWDLELDSATAVAISGKTATIRSMDGVIENRSPFSSRSCAQYRITLRQPVLTAFTFVPITISTSWDASKIALIAESKQLMEETFRVFTHKTSPSPPDKATAESPASLIPVENDQLFKEPSVLCGYGKFHITATEDRDAEDELFIACNGMSVDIYRVQGRWSRIRTIELSPSDSIPDPRRLIEGLRARYFAWSDKTDVVSVCDLESGLLVCCMTLHNGSVKFSDDGSLMALRQAGDIVSTRWTECGTLLNSTDVSRILHPTFLQGNAQIIIPLVAPDEEYGRGQIGMLMDTTSVSTVDRISVPARCFEQQFLTAGARRQFLYSVHGSKLDCTNIKQHVIQPYLQPRYACDNYCFDELSKLPRVDILSTAECAGTFISSSGLKFTVEFRTARTKNWRNGIELQCLVVWISDSAGQLREAVSIPPAEIGNIAGNWLEYRAYFDAVNQQMIVYSNLYVMVWALPITLDGDFELLLTWWTQTAPFQTTDRVDWCWSELARCSHQQLYLKVCNVDDNCEDVAFDIVRLRCDDVFGSEPARFLDGILVLIEMFEASEDEFKPHILKYIGRYLNCHPDKENRSQNIMNKICQHVTQENHVAYGKFLKGLLESSYGRWVPRPDLDENTNPVWLFVNLAKNMPRAISLAQIVIDYCIGMAKKEMDPHFLLPIMGPLQELIRQQDLHTDVALGTLQKLAFIPTMERSYVIDHAIIAQPPEFRWRFWKNNARPLYECDNPVMKLDRNPKIKPHDPLNDNFTRDLFVASFDMLWRAPEAKPDTRSSTARIKSSTRVPQSWVRTLFHIILLNCKLKSDITVECHNFALESMDNPAIAALVEYKWNTIGYSYWLFRFLWQCFYYLLVLVAVFMQVYSDQQESLFGVFIAIIVLAAIFLWLELLQAIHSPSRYFASPYNFVDMVVFALPLAGSICQIINIINDDQTGNTNTLSFSVLFIFLHFLFELRIIKSVCHFVTIIIRIMGEIRVFFVVFAGGILAFTIAILHLLRACTVGTCDTSEVQFPSNFYGAISSTYFFMGGIWDPVSDLFAGDNWAFHTMMIIYFFFTTILLLNVLIALINVAFSAGDEAWLLVWTDNRLRYVESAENLTYHIPGFREAHDWFPKEIYYSATLQEVKDYRNKYFKKNGEDSSRREVTNQRMFGQTLPAKKVAATAAASASAPLARRGSNASAETSLDQQQVIQDLKKVLVEVLGKTDKRVEVLEAQLTEMKQMLSKFCKEP